MRQLHPVGWREKFVARGLYGHTANGQPTGETEQWTQHRLPDGAVLTRVDWTRANHAGFVLVEAWNALTPDPSPSGRRERQLLEALSDVAEMTFQKNAQAERFDIHIHVADAPTIRAAYHVYPLHLDFTLNRDGEAVSESLPLPDGALIDPGAAIFGAPSSRSALRSDFGQQKDAGPLSPSPSGRGVKDLPSGVPDISEILAQESAAKTQPVVIIDFTTAQPLIDYVTLRQLGEESVTIGSETVAARVYNVEWTRGGMSTLWLDAHNVPLKLERGAEAIHLTQYVRAFEAPTR